MTFQSCKTFIALFTALCCARSFAAPPESELSIPLSITLSGGVSLGAYQAGALYYLSLFSHANPGALPLKLVTGASAGGFNALIAGMSFCGTETEDFQQSEFWHSWVSWKGSELLPQKKQGDPRGLLTRAPLEKIAHDVENKWRQGLPETCDFVLGIRATRVRTQEFRSASSLKLERQSEKFSLRIRGRGPGRAPSVTNYVAAPGESSQTLLALSDGDDRQNYEALLDLLFASSAFPIAFPPQKIRTCATADTPRWMQAPLPLTCRPEEIDDAEYFDGGLVDNEPIALAYSLAQEGLRAEPAGEVQWMPVPHDRLSLNPVTDRLLFVNIDLANSSYPAKTTEPDLKHVLPLAITVFGNLFNSSRDSEAIRTLTRDPKFGPRIASLKNQIPRVSDGLVGFFGFTEREFRGFDFYLGFLEMREYLRSTTIGQSLKTPTIAGIPARDSGRLDCLGGWLSNAAGARERCESINDENFFTLARLARERLQTQQSDLGFVFKFLDENKYQYRDLGVSKPGRAPARMKDQALGAITKLAALQTTSDDLVLRALTPLILDNLAPLPNGNTLNLDFGTQLGISASTLLSGHQPYAWRANVGVQFENLSGWFATGGSRVVSTPWLGIEYQPAAFASSYAQLGIELAAGYKLGLSDTDSTCLPGRGDPVACRGVVIRPGLHLTLAERLRLDLDEEIMTFNADNNRVPMQFVPSLGAQFFF